MAKIIKKLVYAVKSRARARKANHMISQATSSGILKKAGMSVGAARFNLKSAKRVKDFGKIEKKPWYVAHKKRKKA